MWLKTNHRLQQKMKLLQYGQGKMTCKPRHWYGFRWEYVRWEIVSPAVPLVHSPCAVRENHVHFNGHVMQPNNIILSTYVNNQLTSIIWKYNNWVSNIIRCHVPSSEVNIDGQKTRSWRWFLVFAISALSSFKSLILMDGQQEKYPTRKKPSPIIHHKRFSSGKLGRE